MAKLTFQQLRAQRREAVILAAVVEAAKAGLPCPTNCDLGELAGYTTSGAWSALKRIAERGDIAIAPLSSGARGGHIVSIPSLGIETADEQVAPARRPIVNIISVVAKTAGLLPSDITGRRRTGLYKRPRFLVCHFARALGWSYARIGKAIHRDHSSVIHGCERARAMLETDKLFARLYTRVEAALAGQAELRIPFIPAARSFSPLANIPLEIGDDGELHPAETKKRPGFDPLLFALKCAHPERFAA